jgi:hypothetical protein
MGRAGASIFGKLPAQLRGHHAQLEAHPERPRTERLYSNLYNNEQPSTSNYYTSVTSLQIIEGS